eukprot:gene24502-30855_t
MQGEFNATAVVDSKDVMFRGVDRIFIEDPVMLKESNLLAHLFTEDNRSRAQQFEPVSVSGDDSVSQSTSIAEILEMISFTETAIEAKITAETITSLVLQVLKDGPIPIGMIGKHLQTMTNNDNLPKILRREFKGLKNILVACPHLFRIGDNHEFNPLVYLAQDKKGTALFNKKHPPQQQATYGNQNQNQYNQSHGQQQLRQQHQPPHHASVALQRQQDKVDRYRSVEAIPQFQSLPPSRQQTGSQIGAHPSGWYQTENQMYQNAPQQVHQQHQQQPLRHVVGSREHLDLSHRVHTSNFGPQQHHESEPMSRVQRNQSVPFHFQQMEIGIQSLEQSHPAVQQQQFSNLNLPSLMRAPQRFVVGSREHLDAQRLQQQQQQIQSQGQRQQESFQQHHKAEESKVPEKVLFNFEALDPPKVVVRPPPQPFQQQLGVQDENVSLHLEEKEWSVDASVFAANYQKLWDQNHSKDSLHSIQKDTTPSP